MLYGGECIHDRESCVIVTIFDLRPWLVIPGKVTWPPGGKPATLPPMAKQHHEPGPPMTLGNMREFEVRYQVAFCHNDACRHQAVIDVATRPRHRCFGSAARPHAATAAASERSAAELERVSNATETQQGKHLDEPWGGSCAAGDPRTDRAKRGVKPPTDGLRATISPAASHLSARKSAALRDQ
jgi:hypothetical protein